MFVTGNLAYAKPPEPKEIKPFADDWYVTPEDIIRDIIFPSIDKRVMKRYQVMMLLRLAGSHRGLLELFITTIILMIFP